MEQLHAERINITVNPDLPELFKRIDTLASDISNPNTRTELTNHIEQAIIRLKAITKSSLEAHQKIADSNASKAVKATAKKTLINTLLPIDERLYRLSRLMTALDYADLGEIVRGREAINQALESEIAEVLKRKQT